MDFFQEKMASLKEFIILLIVALDLKIIKKNITKYQFSKKKNKSKQALFGSPNS